MSSVNIVKRKHFQNIQKFKVRPTFWNILKIFSKGTGSSRNCSILGKIYFYKHETRKMKVSWKHTSFLFYPYLSQILLKFKDLRHFQQQRWWNFQNFQRYIHLSNVWLSYSDPNAGTNVSCHEVKHPYSLSRRQNYVFLRLLLSF